MKIPLPFSTLNFFLMSLSTVFIAAAGYIINDYFDVKTDRINHPETVVIDHAIKRRVAMIAHLTFNIIGVGLGFYVASQVGNIKIGSVHLVAAGLLWYYSTTFKKQLIIGNVIVSLMTAMIPFLVILFEMPPMMHYFSVAYPDEAVGFNGIYKYIFMFSVFAFLTSLIREIIKDMEDVLGDKETGGNTIPIAWGMRTSKVIVISIISNIILLLSFIIYKLYSPLEKLPTYYISIAIILPLLLLIPMLIRAQTQKDYKKLSGLVKIIMLTGISFCFVIYYLANN